MDRAEQAGLGVALAGHGALLILLTLAAAATRLPIPRSAPIEVSFFDEAGPTSTAPTPSATPPAPSVAPELGRPEEPVAPPPAEVVAPRVPAPRPAPTPAPARTPEPPAKAQPAKAVPSRPPASTAKASPPRGSRLGKDFLKGIGAEPSTSRSNAPPAAEAGPAVQAALASLVRRQLKPHWKAPTGADAELLRTELSIALGRDGSVDRVEVLRTTGQTASNRPQVRLHQEQAIRAVRLASPFRLPPEYYDSWKLLSPIGFDKRLSQ
jgi:outer membrane biosynthesis protein TonB